jgi:hypothetical protein
MFEDPGEFNHRGSVSFHCSSANLPIEEFVGKSLGEFFGILLLHLRIRHIFKFAGVDLIEEARVLICILCRQVFRALNRSFEHRRPDL